MRRYAVGTIPNTRTAHPDQNSTNFQQCLPVERFRLESDANLMTVCLRPMSTIHDPDEIELPL